MSLPHVLLISYKRGRFPINAVVELSNKEIFTVKAWDGLCYSELHPQSIS